MGTSLHGGARMGKSGNRHDALSQSRPQSRWTRRFAAIGPLFTAPNGRRTGPGLLAPLLERGLPRFGSATVLALMTLAGLYAAATHIPGWNGHERQAAQIAIWAGADTPDRPHPELAVLSIQVSDLADSPYTRPIDRAVLAEAVSRADQAGARLIILADPIDRPSTAEADAALRAAFAIASAPILAATTAHPSAFARAYFSGVATAPAPVPPARDGFILPPTSDHLAAAAAVRIFDGNSETARIGAMLGQPLDARWSTETGAPGILSLTLDTLRAEATPSLADRTVVIAADFAPSDGTNWRGAALPWEPSRSSGALIAQQIAQMIDGRSLTEAPKAVVWLAAGLAALFAGLGVAAVRFAPAASVLVTAAVGTTVLAASILLRAEADLVISPLAPALAALLSGGLCAGVLGAPRRGLLRRVERALRSRPARRAAPAIRSHMLRSGLDGETRMVTILALHGPSFSALADSRPAQETIAVLRAFCHGLNEAVTQRGGMVETLVPGRMTAVFGAPLPQPNHAIQGLQAARAIADFILRFETRPDALGVSAGAFRIGVHTGPAAVGAFSDRGDDRFAAIGATPDTAWRLAILGQSLGTVVCCTSATVTAARSSGDGDMDLRPVGEIHLPGHIDPMGLFEPLTSVQANLPQTLAYLKAFRALCAGAPESETLFRELLQRDPDDALVALHLGRLRAGETGSLIRRYAA